VGVFVSLLIYLHAIISLKYFKEKVTAFGIHLILSLTAISLFYWYVRHYWYPGTLFELEQTWQGLKILIPVDAILGPILTLVIFVPNKKNLKFDLFFIAFFQLVALFYGASIIHAQRPIVIAFNIKEFQIVLATEISKEKLPMQFFVKKSEQGILPVYAIPPQNEEEITQYLFSPTPYYKEPHRYRALKEYVKVLKKLAISPESISLSQITNAKKLDSIKNYIRVNPNSYLFLLRGSLGNKTYVLIDITKNELINFIDIVSYNDD